MIGGTVRSGIVSAVNQDAGWDSSFAIQISKTKVRRCASLSKDWGLPCSPRTDNGVSNPVDGAGNYGADGRGAGIEAGETSKRGECR
jgi:hypothetical protein